MVPPSYVSESTENLRSVGRFRRCGLRRVRRRRNSMQTAEVKASPSHDGFKQAQFTLKGLQNLSGALRPLDPCPPPVPSKAPPTRIIQRPPRSPSAPSRLCLSVTSTTISLTPFSPSSPAGASGLLLCCSSTASDTLLSATTSSAGPSPVDGGGLLPVTASCISSMTVALAISSAQSDSRVVTDAQTCGRDSPNPKAHERHQTGKRATTTNEINARIGHF